MAPPHLTVLGVPGHRRVELFRTAALAAGLPEPAVLPWADVLRGEFRLTPGTLLRIDSPGEDEAVDRLLRGPALGPGFAATRVEGTAAWYRGFTAALEQVALAVQRTPGAALLGDPEEIATMFDKRRTHRLLEAHGVPVPAALDQSAGPLQGWADLKERLAAAGLRRVFVKPAHASSASGVLALEFGPRGRLQATTSAQLADGELHNSLRVRRYTAEREIAAVVDLLVPDGLQVERWIPKATQRGRAADLRVVVVAGRATHAVVRTSGSPMTNLHLGGARGDLPEARAAAGRRWPELLAVCERAAACFPHAPMVGVDLLPATGWQRHFVGEVNAFGDLLPRLTGLTEGPAVGLDTYGAQVAALLAR
ncbi:STM4014 family protein [Kitasatospora sp. NBC_01302]|uniref:STM4014 family protein n=1 Tax=Kitasatospora sp. NBC_01302 TaxID=2903575 RepID=UPI002E163905|nr:STM4014 family protein [Kitasatospora sp. NBC_01302]